MREDDFEGTSRPSRTGIWGGCLQVLDLSALGVARQNMRVTLGELLAQLDLPEHLSTNALLEVLNALMAREEFQKLYI